MKLDFEYCIEKGFDNEINNPLRNISGIRFSKIQGDEKAIEGMGKEKALKGIENVYDLYSKFKKDKEYEMRIYYIKEDYYN